MITEAAPTDADPENQDAETDSLTVSLPAEMKARIKEAAKADDRSMGSFVRKVLAEAIYGT